MRHSASWVFNAKCCPCMALIQKWGIQATLLKTIQRGTRELNTTPPCSCWQECPLNMGRDPNSGISRTKPRAKCIHCYSYQGSGRGDHERNLKIRTWNMPVIWEAVLPGVLWLRQALHRAGLLFHSPQFHPGPIRRDRGGLRPQRRHSTVATTVVVSGLGREGVLTRVRRRRHHSSVSVGKQQASWRKKCGWDAAKIKREKTTVVFIHSFIPSRSSCIPTLQKLGTVITKLPHDMDPHHPFTWINQFWTPKLCKFWVKLLPESQMVESEIQIM